MAKSLTTKVKVGFSFALGSQLFKTFEFSLKTFEFALKPFKFALKTFQFSLKNF